MSNKHSMSQLLPKLKQMKIMKNPYDNRLKPNRMLDHLMDEI